MRRYSPKNGAVNKASMELLRRQIQEEFLPIIQQVPGFRAYYVLNVANREVITLSFCDTVEGTVESSRCAAEYTFRNPLIYELGRPEVTETEVLAYAEAAREPAANTGDREHAVSAAIALWLEESRSMLLTASEQ